MTYGDDIRAWLADGGSGEVPAGFEGVSSEAFSSALLHFSDSATMPEADALAPFVTRVSPVPFESGDLAPFPEADSVLESGGDAFALLNEVGLADTSATEDAAGTDEPAVTDDVVSALERIENADSADGSEADDGSTFGQGDGDAPAQEAVEVDDAIEILEDAGDGLFEDVLDTAEDGLGIDLEGLDTASFTDLFDQASNAASIDDLDPGDDPAEMDFQ